MPDIRLPLGNTMFALRTAVLCVGDGHLLVVQGEGFSFKYLPGGAVWTGESSAKAAAREWHEETGLTAGPLHLVGVVESFFPLGGQPWHEVGFYYRMDWNPTWPALTALADQAAQEFEWVALADLTAQRVFPGAITQLLQGKAGGVLHLIERAD